MSALNNLVRRLKKVVTGVEAAAPAVPQTFSWEPAAAPAAPAVPAPVAAAPAPAQQPRKRPAAEASSVVGSAIPADVADFSVVYKSAGVQAPPHGYGVDRVAAMLDHRSLAGLDKSVKASAILAALDAAGVKIRDVVQDGLLRYKALCAFEAAKDLEMHGTGPRNQHRIQDLKEEIQAFEEGKRGEIEALTRETAAAVAALSRLKSRQRAEEERFHRTVSQFVEPLPARIIPMPAKASDPPPAGQVPLARPAKPVAVPEPRPGQPASTPALEARPAEPPAAEPPPEAASAGESLTPAVPSEAASPTAAGAPPPEPAYVAPTAAEPAAPSEAGPETGAEPEKKDGEAQS